MKKLTVCFGTRPEAIKMCPLVLYLKDLGDFEVRVVVSGQHKDMLYGALDAFGVRADVDLGVMRTGQTQSYVCASVLEGMSALFERETSDALLVHGDTATAFAASLAAFYARVPIYHVEAGLRSGDMHSPFPEEFYRRSISLMADVHFAPTDVSRENLIREGIESNKVFVTGNTVTDALRHTVSPSFSHPLIEAAGNRKIIFLTAHRRENQGSKMVQMLKGVARVVSARDDVFVIYPVHKSPAVINAAHAALDGVAGITLCEPLGVFDAHNILARSYLVITDSGGLQEEAIALGVPALVMRDTTERPEGIFAGGIELVGTDGERIARSLARLLNDSEYHENMKNAPNPYGNGDSCSKIADIISKISTVHR